jgi:hypothetical protein
MEAVSRDAQRQAQSHDKILSDPSRRTNAESYLAIKRIHIQGSNGDFFLLAPDQVTKSSSVVIKLVSSSLHHFSASQNDLEPSFRG